MGDMVSRYGNDIGKGSIEECTRHLLASSLFPEKGTLLREREGERDVIVGRQTRGWMSDESSKMGSREMRGEKRR